MKVITKFVITCAGGFQMMLIVLTPYGHPFRIIARPANDGLLFVNLVRIYYITFLKTISSTVVGLRLLRIFRCRKLTGHRSFWKVRTRTEWTPSNFGVCTNIWWHVFGIRSQHDDISQEITCWYVLIWSPSSSVSIWLVMPIFHRLNMSVFNTSMLSKLKSISQQVSKKMIADWFQMMLVMLTPYKMCPFRIIGRPCKWCIIVIMEECIT